MYLWRRVSWEAAICHSICQKTKRVRVDVWNQKRADGLISQCSFPECLLRFPKRFSRPVPNPRSGSRVDQQPTGPVCPTQAGASATGLEPGSQWLLQHVRGVASKLPSHLRPHDPQSTSAAQKHSIPAAGHPSSLPRHSTSPHHVHLPYQVLLGPHTTAFLVG